MKPQINTLLRTTSVRSCFSHKSLSSSHFPVSSLRSFSDRTRSAYQHHQRTSSTKNTLLPPRQVSFHSIFLTHTRSVSSFPMQTQSNSGISNQRIITNNQRPHQLALRRYWSDWKTTTALKISTSKSPFYMHPSTARSFRERAQQTTSSHSPLVAAWSAQNNTRTRPSIFTNHQYLSQSSHLFKDALMLPPFRHLLGGRFAPIPVSLTTFFERIESSALAKTSKAAFVALSSWNARHYSFLAENFRPQAGSSIVDLPIGVIKLLIALAKAMFLFIKLFVHAVIVVVLFLFEKEDKKKKDEKTWSEKFKSIFQPEPEPEPEPESWSEFLFGKSQPAGKPSKASKQNENTKQPTSRFTKKTNSDTSPPSSEEIVEEKQWSTNPSEILHFWRNGNKDTPDVQIPKDPATADSKDSKTQLKDNSVQPIVDSAQAVGDQTSPAAESGKIRAWTTKIRNSLSSSNKTASLSEGGDAFPTADTNPSDDQSEVKEKWSTKAAERLKFLVKPQTVTKE